MGTLLDGQIGTSLRLTEVGREDEGQYECVGSNVVGDDRATITLIVYSEFCKPEQLSAGPGPMTVSQHTWVQSLTGDSFSLTIYTFHTCTLKHMQWKCCTQSSAHCVCVCVSPAYPAVAAEPQTLNLQVGSTAMFTCTSSGNPDPLVTWSNEDGVDMTTLGDPRVQVAGGTLVISDIVASDSAELTCTASNSVGANSTTVSLAVLGMHTAL